MTYTPRVHQDFCEAAEAIETALKHEGNGFAEAMSNYAMLAIAMSLHENRHRTIPCSGWVVLEQAGEEKLVASHVVAFQESENANGEDGADLKPMVWITGEGVATATGGKCALVRARSSCGGSRTFEEIADGSGVLTDGERDWAVNVFPLLKDPRGIADD